MGRSTVNALSLCITVGFLLVALECGRGEHTSGIQRMTTEISRAIRKVFKQLEEVPYEEFEYTAQYESSTVFHPKGMNILYNLTNVLTKTLFPEDCTDHIVVEDDPPNVHIKNEDYASLAKTFIPLLIFLCVLALFAVCMPFCGFCFCCCRCCCGSDEIKHTEKNRDLCKKIIYSTLMIGMGTLLLFGVVCSFVSNEHMQTGTDELSANLRVAVSDTRKYFNETNSHLEMLLNRNYRQLSKVLLKTLSESSTILYEELKQITNASSIDDADEMADTMNETLDKLKDLKKLTNNLRVEASQLDDAMRKIKRDLLEDLNRCGAIASCSELKQKYVDSLGTNIDFNSIPDISDDINIITSMKSDRLIDAIKAGKQQLDDLKNGIKAKVDANIKTVEQKVTDAGNEIEKHSKDVRKVIDNTMQELVDKSNDGLSVLDDYIGYSKFRYYVGVGVSVVFLLITLLIALGLICGICGKKPTYNDDCCNKGAGSKFLMCSVTLMFLTSFVLVIILLVHILGMPVQMMVCEPLRHPNSSKVLDFYDEHVDLKRMLGLDTTLKNLINNCYRNGSVYQVFHLESKFNIAEVRGYIAKFQIDEELKRLEETITIDEQHIVLLDANSIANLRELGSNLSGIHDKFDRVKDEVKIDDFTTVELDELMKQLKLVITTLEGLSGNEALVNSLKLSALHLETYIAKLFTPMVENAKKTLNLADEMNEALKLKHDNFNAAINDMADKIEFAQNELSQHGPDKIAEVIRMFAKGITKVLQTYLNRTADSIEKDVGQCGPLALVVNGTLTSTCDKILLPMTGFGVSILWCIMLFIPTTIIAVTLADLYKKTSENYHGYIEADCLYDAYADRENIPLARGKYSGKKKHKKKRHEGGRYMDSEMAARDYPGGSQHTDARYSDMAPNSHRQYEDFPNGGPPQYHRATEYERPPPYYCPGSTNH
ncbi:prominin-like protein isoform X3 [Atheta coriaria]|uniref:prominin-like protein isoform X3 n=1 Tax=Dalotia coriaria TaxID=877792 RepID=UPI0031F4747C